MAKKAPLTKQTSGNKNPKAQSSFVLKPFFHVNPQEIRNALKTKFLWSTAAAVIAFCSGSTTTFHSHTNAKSCGAMSVVETKIFVFAFAKAPVI